MVGCLGKLYGSLENLNDTYLQPNLNKDVLLKPKKLPMPIGGPHQLLPTLIDGESNGKRLYTCQSCQPSSYSYSGEVCYVADDPKAICPKCHNFISKHLTYVARQAVAAGSKGGGFVREAVTYMITDDLEVKPMSVISSIALLKNFDVRDVRSIEEIVVPLDKDKLVHYSANLPEPLRQESSGNSILELYLDADYPTEGYEAATEACCHFWTRVLQRFASAKTQEASELKVMMENLVTVLLTTLNLPEYPASAPILQVLCVLLLQNAGLKSKDIGARTRAIDLLGTIAARLKRDSALGSKDKFWILQELVSVDGDDQTDPKNECSVCLDGRLEKNFFVCQGCQKMFHADCMGVTMQCKDDGTKDRNRSGRNTEVAFSITKLEDDPKSQQKFMYYLARLKSKEVVLDSGTASLMENSPVIRAKALRAVSIIVEADPQVLGDKRVQSAVEGRFCDSAISVREAALELVGRHIASHPDVGLKVAERMKDTGVGVRKRSIKIIRDVCVSNANFSEFTKACIAIISRTGDDESSIKDIVCKKFYEFWFEEPTGSQTQFFGDGSSVPLEVAKKTEQIVEMLRRMPSHQLLVTVIKSNLALDFFPQSVKAIGINPVSLASVRKRCELMCKFLLERILQVEEMTIQEGERRTFPYMLALHAFCVVDQHFVHQLLTLPSLWSLFSLI
ncbi:unnamed protein product [Prunus armeniaca]|uniref:Pep3/Vps18 RING C-terminal domain-containing protein n=1 Tax=Prunus armeniaca TaxID=36596 RepID=A0A6J5UTP2_PRUAR|nr:unnamed protein product [Prunus armeniaca]